MLAIDYGVSNTRVAHSDPIRGTVETFVGSGAVRPLEAVYAQALAVHRDRPPATVVFTHPDSWAEEQIRALTDSGVRAGIDSRAIRTVPEAHAAAEYYARLADPAVGSTLVVVDFGATLSVTALTVTGNGFRTEAARGDHTLGGRTFDTVVRRWAEGALVADGPEVCEEVKSAPLHVHRHLEEQIRQVKETLSRESSATVTVPLAAGVRTYTLTRDEFDTLIGSHVDRAVRAVRGTLTDAGLTEPDVLYATGGSSRIPLVRTRLADLGPLVAPNHADTAVAEGAIITVENRRRAARARAMAWLRPVGIGVALILVVAGLVLAASRGLTAGITHAHLESMSASIFPVPGTSGPPATSH